jgi:hypothetical protein
MAFKELTLTELIGATKGLSVDTGARGVSGGEGGSSLEPSWCRQGPSGGGGDESLILPFNSRIGNVRQLVKVTRETHGECCRKPNSLHSP